MYDVSWISAERYEIEGTYCRHYDSSSVMDENRFRYDLGSLGQRITSESAKMRLIFEKNIAMVWWNKDPKSEMYKLPAMLLVSMQSKMLY